MSTILTSEYLTHATELMIVNIANYKYTALNYYMYKMKEVNMCITLIFYYLVV